MAEAFRRLPGPARELLKLAVVALAYYIAARLSLQLALVRGQVTPVWPPTGIALVSMLVLGPRVWPAVTVAAFAVNLPLGPNPLGAGVIALGNTLAPLSAAYLMRATGFRPELDRLRDAASIIIIGALAGMAVSASVGSLVLLLSGSVPAGNFASLHLTRTDSSDGSTKSYWFVRGVGKVREATSGGHIEELTSYHQP